MDHTDNRETSKERSGRYPVKGMFDVELPEEHFNKFKKVPSEDGSNQAYNAKVPVMVDRHDSPTSYPCLIARFSLIYLNMVSLECIGLAIGVSLFSILFGSALKKTSENMPRLCGMNLNENSLAATNQLIRTQAYGGVNATIWNMKQSAMSSLKSEFQSYSVAGVLLCNAENSAAENATDSMARWATTAALKAKNTTVNLFESLEGVERALESSGYFNGLTSNVTNAFNIEVPSDSFQVNCRNISNSTLTEALTQVEIVLKSAQSRLASVMNEPLPELNGTKVANITANLTHTDLFGISKPTKAWVATFSVAAFLAIFPAAYKEYSFWHYQLNIAKSLISSQPFDHLQTFHSMFYRTGTSIAEALSALFITSDHKTRQTYVEWAVNYALSSNLRRLLHLCIFLGILGIANSTITGRAKLPHCDATTRDALLHSSQSLQASFQQSLNQNLVELVSAAVKELGDNHIKFVEGLKNSTRLDLGNVLSPFANGVALEYVALPTVINSPETFEGHAADDITSLLESINSAIWISSIIAFAIWVLFAGSASLWASYKVYKTPDDYGRYDTPISRF